jgi:hypothetical protein
MAPSRTVLLIPYYNSGKSLLASLRSVESSERCDVLIVDDGSTREPLDEESARAVWHAQGELHTLVLPQNAGIEHALNAGLDWIAERPYTYIARLDCGDLNRPGRLARQERFLDEHPDVLLLGGAAAFVDTDGVQQFILRLPTEHDQIVAAMWRNSAFMHPAVMFRASALPLVGRYPLDTPAAEDYGFFWRFIEAGRVANLPDVLIDYELDPGGISLGKRTIQLESRLKIQRAHDDGSLRARAGIARTILLLRLPYGPVFQAKRVLHGRLRGSSGHVGQPGQPAHSDGTTVPHGQRMPTASAPIRPPLRHLSAASVREYLLALPAAVADELPAAVASAHPDSPTIIALVVGGAVPDVHERLAIDFCARGPSVRLVPVTRAALAAQSRDFDDQLAGVLGAVVSIKGPTPHLPGVPTLIFTDADGIALPDSARVARAVRRNLAGITIRLGDSLGSVLAEGEVAPRRTVAATRERMWRVAGPLLVIAARSLPLPAPPPQAALKLDVPAVRPALADALGAVWFAGRFAQRLVSVRQWELGRVAAPTALPDLLDVGATAAAPSRWVSAPTPDFWADPCLLVVDGQHFLFVEELDMDTGKGAIRTLQVDGDDLAPLGVVLRTDHHLSYPQVYRMGGRWLATVETCGARNPIYTFQSPGDPWIEAPDLPLLPPHIADPTLLFDQPAVDGGSLGATRITGLIGTDAAVDSDAVVVQFVLTDIGSWRREDHIVRVSAINGRSGGTLDPIRGLRATQDCSGVYGRAVELLAFPDSDPVDVALRVDAGDAGQDDAGRRQQGLHTLTWSPDGCHAWVDGWHRRITPFGLLWHHRERQHLASCQG